MTKITKEATVNVPVDLAYSIWRNFENFPSFMEHIEEVRVTSDKMSHWKASGPLGLSAEWDAEIIVDNPREAIGWRTVEGASSVVTAGRVNFRDDGHGATCIEVTIEYAPPGGPLGDLVAKIFANPDKHVEEDLERFRAIVEQAHAAAQAGTPSGGESLGGSMGAITEHDLADAERITAGGDMPPRDTDALRRGDGP